MGEDKDLWIMLHSFNALRRKNIALDEGIRKSLEHLNNFYEVTNDKMMKIPEDSIYYVQKEKKYVNVVYVDKEERKEKVRMTLAEAYDRLTKQNFLYIDRSCIVNIMHIMALENRKVKLRNGIYLDISQPQYANVRRQISDYWSNRG